MVKAFIRVAVVVVIVVVVAGLQSLPGGSLVWASIDFEHGR